MDDISKLPEEKMRELLGSEAEGKSADEMRSILREAAANAEIESGEDADVELVPTDEPEADAGSEETVTVPMSLIEKLQQRLDTLERREKETDEKLKAFSRRDRRSKEEAAFSRVRVSDFYRDFIAEQRWILEHPEMRGKKHLVVVVPRTYEVEKHAFNFPSQRYSPCAENGGLYYLRNKEWQASPRDGRTRERVLFNRHLYGDFTVKGNKYELLRKDYELIDMNGKVVKPFSEELPLEDSAEVFRKGRDRKKHENDVSLAMAMKEAMKQLQEENKDGD